VNEEKGDRQKALRTLSRLIRRLFQRYRPKADIGRVEIPRRSELPRLCYRRVLSRQRATRLG
jgi:hypothetical protein